MQVKQFEQQRKLRHGVIYNEYLWVNIDFVNMNNIIKKWYYQDKVKLVQHNYSTNSSIGNFKEPQRTEIINICYNIILRYFSAFFVEERY